MGEERLLSAVEKGQLPLSIAMKIASSPGEEQRALQEAYESKELRGKKFIMAQRLVEKRHNLGKGMRKGGHKRNTDGSSISTRQMLRKFIVCALSLKNQTQRTTRSSSLWNHFLIF
jgi:ParB family chromosome partitioning protein